MLSLCWRYLKRAPSPEALDHHAARLISGAITRAALEQEFSACPEAKVAMPPTDESFVWSLFWRYFGRAPDPADFDSLRAMRSLLPNLIRSARASRCARRDRTCRAS